ncbi:MAG: M23 family metallopeptidase [Treponemataceae bacterium]|nr:M23 family metallopeptidase [Treponemataceae bacterium]
MEIISYLNPSVLEDPGYESLPLDALLQTQNRINRKKKTRTQSSADVFADLTVYAEELAASLWRLRYVLLSLIAAGFLTVLGYSGYQSVHSMPHAVSFRTPMQEEIDLMASAMKEFVSRNDSDEFDENGNLFETDGVPFTEPVSYISYTVKSGENISSISKKFGLSNISTLIAVNNIQNVRTLRAGQVLSVPNTDGIIHTVGAGESLAGISAKYKIAVEDILDVNDLETSVIIKGQRLFIPGVHLDNGTLKKALGELFMNPLSATYRISSYFGLRADPFTGVRSNHTGMDLACPTGTPIKCAKSGRVATVGWTNVYGNYVIVTHDNGYQTLYAHMSKTSVKTGQVVDQGTQLGLVGSTGYSTGPHLHFSVYKNGKLVDPQTLIKF